MQHPHYLATIARVANPRRLSTITKPVKVVADRSQQAILIAEYCAALYDASRQNIRAALKDFSANSSIDPECIFDRIRNACYPYIGVEKKFIKQNGIVDLGDPHVVRLRSIDHASTIADPDVFMLYIKEQVLRLLNDGYMVEAGLSIVPIPVTYAVERQDL